VALGGGDHSRLDVPMSRSISVLVYARRVVYLGEGRVWEIGTGESRRDKSPKADLSI